jgi:t-SNARE complex subunit (syntaxin)
METEQLSLFNDHWVMEEIKKEIKDFSKLNENMGATYANGYDTLKEVLREKSIAISALIKKLESSYTNELKVYLKEKKKKKKEKKKKKKAEKKWRAEIRKSGLTVLRPVAQQPSLEGTRNKVSCFAEGELPA